MPLGAAQGAHYPAGTRGDIQAVTVILILNNTNGILSNIGNVMLGDSMLKSSF